MEIFFSKSISAGYIILDEIESRHCVKVLRHKTGDLIKIMDGSGAFYTGEIVETGGRNVKLKIVSVERADRNPSGYLHICVALTKNSERYEWFLEKAAEIGVDEITPLVADHSERKVLFKPQRIENILISAAKQSQQAFIPRFNPLTPVRNVIDSASGFDGVKLIGYCGEWKADSLSSNRKINIMDALKGARKALILIGPEGDFSPAEVEYALGAGFQIMTLADTILRVETAALMAVAAFSLHEI